MSIKHFSYRRHLVNNNNLLLQMMKMIKFYKKKHKMLMIWPKLKKREFQMKTIKNCKES